MKNRMLIVILFTLFGAGSAYANTMATHEINDAIMQAKAANKTMSLSKVDMHLHRIINCLVGKKDLDFDASAGDPCMHGHGAINDFQGGMLDHKMLQQALEDANYGLLTKRVQIARNAADLAKDRLQDAKEGI